ncbi:hypothetical protein ACHAXT_007308 [Thalassiosira profunda]
MYRLGDYVEQDLEKAVFHWEEAAIGGNLNARYWLGEWENDEGRAGSAIKHWIIAAKMGDDNALSAVKAAYTQGHASKEEFTACLRAWKDSVDATKSKAREEASYHTSSDGEPYRSK